MKTTVGLDTSLTSTGIAIVTTLGISTHRVRSSGKKDDTLLQRRGRLARIAGEIVGIVTKAEPDLIVIEGPSYGSQHGHPHDRSGLWWLVTYSLIGLDIPVLEVPPTVRIRYAVGKGGGKGAGKDDVLTAVVKRYGHQAQLLTGNDEADALVLAAMGARLQGEPIELSLPLACHEAMKTLVMPGKP